MKQLNTYMNDMENKKQKKLIWCKYNKIIISYKPIIFSGLTGNIIEFDSILELIVFLIRMKGNKYKEKLIKAGFLTYNSDILYNAQVRSIKQINNSSPYIVIIPTTNCNFNCDYCYVKHSLGETKLSKNYIDAIIQYLKAHNKEYRIEWFGGEPTLAKDLIQYFYNEADKENLKNCKSLLITNGSFSKSFFPIIKNHISHIQFTFDGLYKTHNERKKSFLTSRSSFDKNIQNLDELYKIIKNQESKMYLSIGIRCNIDKNNMNEFIQLREFLLSRYNNLFKVYCAKINGTSRINLTNKEYANFILKLYTNFGIVADNPLPKEDISFSHCGFVYQKSFTVAPSGELFKCPLDFEYENRKIAHLTNKHINSFLDNEGDYILSTTSKLPNECKKCYLLLFCWGGCPHNRISKRMKKDCPYQKEKILDFLKMKKELDEAKNYIKTYEVIFK